MKKKAFLYLGILIVAALLILFFFTRGGDKYYQSREYTWYSEIGTKEGNVLIRGTKVDKIKHDIPKLIYALNKSEKDPETFRTPEGQEPNAPPKLKLKNINGQVVNIEVINNQFLTQRMGSTGAEQFLAAATFTLTENDNIKFVNFIFEEGDHAVPGLYSRGYFLNNWKILK
jgi:hypothetical protein